MLASDHFAAAALAQLCALKGVRHAVISPGSRNAPLVISFHHEPAIQCLTVIDERSAAFFALGMAQQLGAPVALICTSGSAVLNYGPAIAEAFYQRIPLLVITADRPEEWVDQGEGQAIRQRNVLTLHMKASFQLPRAPGDDLSRWQCSRSINEAIDACMHGGAGPVHINVPFDEPLYGVVEIMTAPRPITTVPTEAFVLPDHARALIAQLSAASRVMVLAGQGKGGSVLVDLLRTLAAHPQFVVLTEATSNLEDPAFITCIDRTIEDIGNDEAGLRPEILITIGGAVVSKRIKALLRKWRPVEHWNIDPVQRHFDTYQSLTHDIAVTAEVFFSQMGEALPEKMSGGADGGYAARWKALSDRARDAHHLILADAPFCDLTVFKALLERIPQGADVHLANSTPARYAQLFDRTRGLRFFGNRGTSGIDGCVSTAVGAAFATERPTTVICGDIAFAYDSNAFWNKHLSPHLRVIVIDNDGGNIFRFIPGPDEHPELLPYFETPHGRNIAQLVGSYGLPYFQAFDMQSLENGIEELYQEYDAPAVLHVRTDAQLSPRVLREYFKELKEA